MSEFALSSQEETPNRKKIGFSSLLLSDFHLLCSFILSHPFYFSYLLFFSPYIFKVLSFLSPLFVTTTLLLLALLSTLHVQDTCPDSESLEAQPSFLFSYCSKLGSVLEHKFEINDDEGIKSVEELEAYKMVVEACSMELRTSENEMCSDELTFVDKFCSHESTVPEALTDETREEHVEIKPLKLEDVIDLEKEEETKKFEKEEEEEEEFKKCEKEEEEEHKVKTKSDVVLDNEEEPTKEESKAQKVDLVGDGNDESYNFPKLSNFLGEGKRNEVITKKEEEEDNVSLQSFGSMRKEKEWRRTLACKLFEERHNADVGQGMDQLWETYETQTEKKHQTEEEKKKLKKKTKSMMKTKSIIEKEVIVEEDDDDVIDHQQLCCLQALKFSTGKMHLGIARPNLLKLSKAFKGIGRFYNANKHSKNA
ncbi:PREDICTED: vicilin-like seed storage protein At2g18540 [Camelina sativa]|uniref:Vicilin-like seed storage protein At2g18540 n=1 Tax=Camelina sativa TaxID=90675 RepID=A0ABM0XNQ8_CAMSA|nr:PREDICTED: vicilin-like seed storage protein At2g18540 [Camelina sativa]